MTTTKYKGWTIEKHTHPKLTGKYSIRADNIKQAKAIIRKCQ